MAGAENTVVPFENETNHGHHGHKQQTPPATSPPFKKTLDQKFNV
jgi:hypothetical protein